MVLGMLMVSLGDYPILPGLVLIAAGCVTLLGQSLALIRALSSRELASP